MNLIEKFVVLFSICVLSKQEEHCTSKDSCSNDIEEKTGPVRYDETSNIIIKNIEDALRSYVPCPKENCTCHTGVIDKDLSPFKETGITQSMIHRVSDRGTKYQIRNHKLYRQKDCMFPARCSGIEHFIKLLLNKLPNMEMIINCRDYPQIHKSNLGKLTMGPVFSFSKTDDYLDIMYPAWSFWEGGPAISLYPTGLGRWDKHRLSITETNKKWPWNDKINKAFFRGSRTSDERDALILLSREIPNLVDAQYTKNQAWKSRKDTLDTDPAQEITLEEHCKYKYLFNFRGVAASFRLKHLFLCKSLVFHVGNDWKEFFYDAMIPWVHYVPIKSYPTKDELRNMIEFFKEHDDIAQSIAMKGYRFIWDYLRMKDIECYWETLLMEYSKLIKYTIKFDDNLIEVK